MKKSNKKTSNKKAAKSVKKAVMSNAQYIFQNESFKKAVQETKAAGFEVNEMTRQASKYRNKKGIVYLFTTGMIKGVK